MVEKLNSKSVKRAVALLGLAFLFLHFSMISLYTVPGLPAPQAMFKASRNYTWPMFHQGWQLFAPDVPGYYNTLEYRAKGEGEWSDWVLASDLGKKSGHGKVKYTMHKLGQQLSNAVSNPQTGVYYVDNLPQLDKVRTSSAYHFAIFYCRQSYGHRTEMEADSIQLRLGYITTPDFHSGEKSVEDMVFTFDPEPCQ